MFLGIVYKTKEEVEALFLKLRLVVVTPWFLLVEDVELLFSVTYLLEI